MLPEQGMNWLIHEYLAAWNARAWGRLKTTLTPNATCLWPALGGDAEGRERVLQVLQQWANARPDTSGVIDGLAVQRDSTVVAHIVWRQRVGALGPGSSAETAQTESQPTASTRGIFTVDGARIARIQLAPIAR